MAVLTHLPARSRPYPVDTRSLPGSRGRPRLGPLAIGCLVLSFCCGSVGAQPVRINREYEIKAAAVFNCLPFAEWPPSAFPEPGSPIVIGILGADPFDGLLDALIAGESFHGRPLAIKRFVQADEIDRCHVLFVSRSEIAEWLRVAHKFSGRPVLTIGDAENFARNGGMIEFRIEQNKVRIVVNVRSVRESGLTLSSRLLKLAEIVGEEGIP